MGGRVRAPRARSGGRLMARARGRAARRPTVTLEQGAAPGGARCPACDQPLFVWVETEGWGPREDQVIDRCENCGLAAPRDAVPGAEEAVAQLMGASGQRPSRLPRPERLEHAGLARSRELGGTAPGRHRAHALAARRRAAAGEARTGGERGPPPGPRRDGLDVADAAEPAHLPPRLRLRGALGPAAARRREGTGGLRDRRHGHGPGGDPNRDPRRGAGGRRRRCPPGRRDRGHAAPRQAA